MRTGRLSVPGEGGRQAWATLVCPHVLAPTCLSSTHVPEQSPTRREQPSRGCTGAPTYRGTHLACGVPSASSRLSFLPVEWDDWTFLMGLLWDFGVNTRKACVKTFNACAQPRYSRTGPYRHTHSNLLHTHIPRLHIRTYTHSSTRARPPSSVPAPHLFLTRGCHGHILPDTLTHLHTAERTSFVSTCLQTVPLVTQSRSQPTLLLGPHRCLPAPHPQRGP